MCHAKKSKLKYPEDFFLVRNKMQGDAAVAESQLRLGMLLISVYQIKAGSIVRILLHVPESYLTCWGGMRRWDAC